VEFTETYRVQVLTTAVPTITEDMTEDMTVEDMEATVVTNAWAISIGL
jgi:hypothetical protein